MPAGNFSVDDNGVCASFLMANSILGCSFYHHFDLYWLFRVFYLAFHQIASYRKMEENLKINWLEKLEKENGTDWGNIRHLIIFPFSSERKEVVHSSLLSVKNAIYPKNKIIIVLALEERSGEMGKKIACDLEQEFKNDFALTVISVHPANIPGEIAGKGSNVNAAVNTIKTHVLPRLDVPVENVIVSLFDIDTKPYPHYFSCLTWCYLNTKNPLKKSYQPIPVYNNNIWDAPAFSRIIATSSTFWQMMQQERTEQLVTFSSHAMPLKTLLEVGYPANIVSDDSRIFWRAFLKNRGRYEVMPLYYPVSLDAVLSDSFMKTIVNQYKQQRRWSWGVENVPYVFTIFEKSRRQADKMAHQDFSYSDND